jgi:hypothetical protein
MAVMIGRPRQSWRGPEYLNTEAQWWRWVAVARVNSEDDVIDTDKYNTLEALMLGCGRSRVVSYKTTHHRAT